MRLAGCIWTLICCCLSLPGAAQPEKTELSGVAETPGDRPVSYFVSFTVSGSRIKGYSITGAKDGNALRTEVDGQLDGAGNLIIHEIPFANEPAPGISGQVYCYFTARLTLEVRNGIRYWSGPFTSMQSDRTPCPDGTMYLKEPTPPPPKAKPVPAVPPLKPLPLAERAPLKPVLPPPPLPVRLAVPKIIRPDERSAARPDTSGQKLLYEWESDTVVLEIWDGFDLDGDAVSISWNGSLIKAPYKMGREKLKFSLPLESGVNMLTILLEEEGGEPPITPNIILYDGTRKRELNISGSKGQTANIYFRKKS